jgi:hypothetical protein
MKDIKTGFFKFLSEKDGKKIPLRLKLCHFHEELTEEDLNIKGDLNLSYTTITSLPENLRVTGNLYLSGTLIDKLPVNLFVLGTISLDNTPIIQKYNKKLLKSFFVCKNLYTDSFGQEGEPKPLESYKAEKPWKYKSKQNKKSSFISYNF